MTKMQFSNFEGVNFIIEVDSITSTTWSFFWILLLTPSKNDFLLTIFQKNKLKIGDGSFIAGIDEDMLSFNIYPPSSLNFVSNTSKIFSEIYGILGGKALTKILFLDVLATKFRDVGGWLLKLSISSIDSSNKIAVTYFQFFLTSS